MQKTLYIPIDTTIDNLVECKKLVKRGDTLTLTIKVFVNGVLADLTGQSIDLILKKADGTKIEKTVDISNITNGVITVKPGQQSSLAEGIVYGELQIYTSDTLSSTNTFTYKVDASLADDIVEISKDDIQVLADLRNLIASGQVTIEEYKNNILAIGNSVEAIEALANIKLYIDTNLPALENANAQAIVNIANETTQNTQATQNIDDLTSINNTASTLKTGLEADIASGTTLKNTLEADIVTGNTLKTNLESDISTGDTLKTNLEADIASGTTLKNNIDAENVRAEANIVAMEGFGDVTALSQNVTNLKNEVETARNGEVSLDARLDKNDTLVASHSTQLSDMEQQKANETDVARTTTAKDVTGAINELNTNKAKKTEINNLATTKANQSDVVNIQTQVNNLVLGTSGTDITEVVQARGNYSTINDRITKDIAKSNMNIVLDSVYDKNTMIVSNYYVNGTAITALTNATYSKIPILASNLYLLCSTNSLTGTASTILFLDSSLTALKSVSISTLEVAYVSGYSYCYKFLAPANTAYVCFTTNDGGNWNIASNIDLKHYYSNDASVTNGITNLYGHDIADAIARASIANVATVKYDLYDAITMKITGYYISDYSSIVAETNSSYAKLPVTSSGKYIIGRNKALTSTEMIVFLDSSSTVIWSILLSKLETIIVSGFTYGWIVNIPSNAVYMCMTTQYSTFWASAICLYDYYAFYNNGIYKFNGNIIADKELRAIVASLVKKVNYIDLLCGKKWAVIGDSLTDTTISPNVKYHTLIAQETGINAIDYGKGGSGYKNLDNNFMYRATQIPTDSDIVTIMGSINDITNSYTLGTKTDNTIDTIGGCINIAINNVYARIPNAHLGIISPLPNAYYYPSITNDMTTLVTLLKDICEMRGIPFLDLYHSSNMRTWDTAFRSAYMNDETHPNAEGHKIFYRRIREFIRGL